MSAWAAQKVGAGLGIPVVVTFHALGSVKRRHQGSADTSPAERIAVETELLTTVDRVVATSTDEVEELHRLHPDPVPTSVVPCGVDTELFTPLGHSVGGRSRRHRVVTLGRLVPRKGYDTVVTALVGVPDTELLIAGGTRAPEPERDRLQHLAAEIGVADRVRFLPQVPHPEVPALLRSADVVVTTPWYEPFGIVPVEAMACGRPVVGSAVGGLLDTVAPGRTGVLVPPRDPDALATALLDLLNRPAERDRLGANGVRRVARHYTWPRVAVNTVEAYRATLRTAAGAAPMAVGGRR
jgi:glycosyltransferase involved in cell wall biosynthesis